MVTLVPRVGISATLLWNSDSSVQSDVSSSLPENRNHPIHPYFGGCTEVSVIASIRDSGLLSGGYIPLHRIGETSSIEVTSLLDGNGDSRIESVDYFVSARAAPTGLYTSV